MRDPARTARTSAPRQSGILLLELAALVLLTIADWLGYVPLSRTPFLVLLCWMSLRLRHLRWRDIGFSLPDRPRRVIVIGILAGLAIEALATGVTTPLIESITGKALDLSDLAGLVGNLPVLLIFLAINWILAALGEEVAFRGYLMNRTADVLGRTRVAWAASLLLVSVYFGLGHAYQGVTGIVQESVSAVWLGLLFLLTGRNLTAPILAHGVSNSLALVLIYLGRYPGLG